MSNTLPVRVSERRDRNAADGRLCAASARCSRAATVRLRDGDSPTEECLVMCYPHSLSYPVGFRGDNFTVTAHETF